MSEQVHQMFSEIAPRYDLTNRILSFGIDGHWRKCAVKLGHPTPGDAVLDCATGTGDLAFAWEKAVGPTGRVLGTDFTEAMLTRARAKAQRHQSRVEFQLADATQLPFADASWNIVSIAFGIRNVDSPSACLHELGRVTKPGGRVIILEFGQPTGVFGTTFKFYSRHAIPAVGQLLTGNRPAYEYLPRTAAAFPSGDAFKALMESTGKFSSIEAVPLTFGVTYAYVGVRAAS